MHSLAEGLLGTRLWAKHTVVRCTRTQALPYPEVFMVLVPSIHKQGNPQPPNLSSAACDACLYSVDILTSLGRGGASGHTVSVHRGECVHDKAFAHNTAWLLAYHGPALCDMQMNFKMFSNCSQQELGKLDAPLERCGWFGGYWHHAVAFIVRRRRNRRHSIVENVISKTTCSTSTVPSASAGVLSSCSTTCT
jgi:hypothetical protein